MTADSYYRFFIEIVIGVGIKSILSGDVLIRGSVQYVLNQFIGFVTVLVFNNIKYVMKNKKITFKLSTSTSTNFISLILESEISDSFTIQFPCMS